MGKDDFVAALAPFSSKVYKQSQLTYANQLEVCDSISPIDVKASPPGGLPLDAQPLIV